MDFRGVKKIAPGWVAADVGRHPLSPQALTPAGLFLTARAPTGQAAAGSVITWHEERADMTRGMNQLRPDAAGALRPLALNIKARGYTRVKIIR